jgi:hypothetical protein
VVLVLVFGVAGFFMGRSAGSSEAQSIRTEFLQSRQGGPGGDPSQAGQQARGGGAPAAGRQTASGTVKSVQGNVVQISQRDGTTTSVTVDDKMGVTKTVTGTIADIQPGLNITIFEATANGATVQRIVLTQEQAPGQAAPGQRPNQTPGASSKQAP